MKRYFKPIAFSVAVSAAAMTFNACNSGQQAPKANRSEIEKEVKEIVYPLPTSFEVTEMLNRIGASYIIGVSNPVANASKYMSEKSQAMNLGVYGSDLSYASTYRQRQEIVDYMTASRQLIEELNISAAIDPEIIDKLEANADNKDALVKIISDSFYNTYSFLQKNDRSGVSALIMAGSWVEALYIATHISEDTYNNKEMVKIVMDQGVTLKKLLDILAKDAANKDVAETINDLAPLKAIYESINGGISEEQLGSITKEVQTLRAKIVG
jgi:hypothetical protein